MQTTGLIERETFNLGPGPACAVGWDDAGLPARVTDPSCVSPVNLLGFCDEAGTLFVQPRLEREVNVLDWGLDPSGLTPCDVGFAALIARIDTTRSMQTKIYFPAGIYRFDQPAPSVPPGVWIVGDGVGSSRAPRFYTNSGTRLAFFGSGAFIRFDLSGIAANGAHRGGVAHVEILCGNPSGAAAYPSIGEIGIEVLGDAQVTIAHCRFGAFKYSISIDGGEGAWLHDLTFDSSQFTIVQADGSFAHYSGYADMGTDRDSVALALAVGTTVQFVPASGGDRAKLVRSTGSWVAEGWKPGTSMFVSGSSLNNGTVVPIDVTTTTITLADRQPCVLETCAPAITATQFDSACAIRVGEFKFAVGGSANGVYIDRIQFNNSRWGTWHHGGIGHSVRQGNYELGGGYAVIDGVESAVFSELVGEGYRHGVGAIWIRPGASALRVTVRDCFFGSDRPAWRNDGVVYGGTFEGNMATSCAPYKPLDGSGYWYDMNCPPYSNVLSPTDPVLCASFFAVSAYVGHGTPVNHATAVRANLDVALVDFSLPGDVIRSVDHVLHERSATAYNGGKNASIRRVYSTNTGKPWSVKGDVLEGAELLTTDAPKDISAIEIPDHGAGWVEVEVVANSSANDGKMARWKIKQAVRREDGATVAGMYLVGSPTVTLAEDPFDGSFVAPSIVVVGNGSALSGNPLVGVAVRVTHHPTLNTNWSANVSFHTAGR